MLAELESIPGSERWTLVSVQGLHRFDARGHGKVVASWMTREDCDQAIADNLGYVNRVVRAALPGAGDEATVASGFSQGVAMAYRAAVMGERRAAVVIAIGGDVPPDVKEAPSDRFPPILIAGGESDEWYTAAKLEADEVFLRGRGHPDEIFRYAGGHVWTARPNCAAASTRSSTSRPDSSWSPVRRTNRGPGTRTQGPGTICPRPSTGPLSSAASAEAWTGM